MQTEAFGCNRFRLRLRLALLDLMVMGKLKGGEGVRVYGFINLWSDNRCPGRRSRYWKAWSRATKLA